MAKVAFVCVGSAGRSQMATAFAERERKQPYLDDTLEIVTGGTDPYDRVPDDVIEVLREREIDTDDRTPRRITPYDVADAEYIVPMGRSIDGFVPDDWEGTAEQLDLVHPGSEDLDAVRSQRGEPRRRVEEFFGRIEPAGG